MNRNEPEISVVMSVYNSAETLSQTVDSILAQDGVEFELVVVDDGSTDGSAGILDSYAARDPRVRVLHQANTGLTAALVRGCAAARGALIARHDAGGDVSLPGRMKAQRDLLQGEPNAVMASCGTRFVGPEGENLYEEKQTSEALQAGLGMLTLAEIRGPSHHGSVVFRREAYERAGGYRVLFPVAQDLDLWLRMAETGPCLASPEIGYVARLAPGAISISRRDEQIRVTRVLLECAALRRNGGDEASVLDRWRSDRPRRTPRLRLWPGLDQARFYYFIGSCLRGSAPALASAHFRRAIRRFPFYPRAWYGLLRVWGSS